MTSGDRKFYQNKKSPNVFPIYSTKIFSTFLKTQENSQNSQALVEKYKNIS